MSRSEIEEKVIGCVCSAYGVTPDKVTLDTRMREELNEASVLLVGMVALIEEELDVLLPLAEAGAAETVRAVVDLVAAQL